METKIANKKKTETPPKKALSDRSQKKAAIKLNIGAAVKALGKYRAEPSQ